VAPAPLLSKLGTGHGRSEASYAQVTRFERESANPTATITIHYDRRDNLIAMGVLRRRSRGPEPLPGWARFVPDPVADLHASIAPRPGRSHTRGDARARHCPS
jgi:hypothetical protein